MKPPRFAYHDPLTRSEALALLEDFADEAKILAGGQSLVPLLNMRLAQPAHLIDINRVSDLAYIREQDGGLAIGALTRDRAAERSSLVRERCPLLAEALPFVGHAPIRARGTIGGSLAHADPAAELPAIMLALDGRVRAASRAGSREIPAAGFFVSHLQTALASTELLTEVWFPAIPPRSGAAFLEVSRRHGDFALAGVATQLTLDEHGAIAQARLALLGVGETPLRAREAEKMLVGERPGAALFEAAGQGARAALDPPGDMHASPAYRRYVAGTLVSRALSIAAERAQQQGGER